MASLKGKTFWITGASSGIGEALSYLVNQQGASVIISSRNQSTLEAVKEKCDSPERVHIIPLDLANYAHFDQLAQQVWKDFGPIDYLVNNGGISQRANAIDTTLDVDKKIMEVNYFGTIALTKSVLPLMKERKSGHLIVISSIAGKFGFYLRSAYSAAKHALHGFFESLRLEEENNGINVTIVCPGQIQTNISVNAIDGKGQSHGKMDNNQAQGYPVDKCAQDILNGIIKNKEEILVGGKEVMAVRIKRLFPALFGKIIRKQSPT